MKDYGHNGMRKDGMYEMHPSGDIVTEEEMRRRPPRKQSTSNDCMGLSWEQIAEKQGGQNTLDITRQKKT